MKQPRCKFEECLLHYEIAVCLVEQPTEIHLACDLGGSFAKCQSPAPRSLRSYLFPGRRLKRGFERRQNPRWDNDSRRTQRGPPFSKNFAIGWEIIAILPAPAKNQDSLQVIEERGQPDFLFNEAALCDEPRPHRLLRGTEP